MVFQLKKVIRDRSVLLYFVIVNLLSLIKNLVCSLAKIEDK